MLGAEFTCTHDPRPRLALPAILVYKRLTQGWFQQRSDWRPARYRRWCGNPKHRHRVRVVLTA